MTDLYKQDIPSRALAVGVLCPVGIFVYLCVLTNAYPKSILQQMYMNECQNRAFFRGRTLLFEDSKSLQAYVNLQTATYNASPSAFNVSATRSLFCTPNPNSSRRLNFGTSTGNASESSTFQAIRALDVVQYTVCVGGPRYF